jgi:putative transposase
LFPMKLSADGAGNSAPPMRGNCAARNRRIVTSGIWMRSWLPSAGEHIGFGAVDQDGYVLDEIVQTRRNTKAAERLLIRLLKKQGLAPRRIITDKLRSYGAAKRDVMPAVEHRSQKGLNNRAESSHLPLRKRERMMQGFRSPGVCSRSSTSSQRCEISSSHQAPNTPRWPSISNASRPWWNGKP